MSKSGKREVKNYPGEEASRDFCEVFSSHCSGCRRECACGREHFDTQNSYDWEPMEFEGLLEKAKMDPDNYIGHDYAVSTVAFNGLEVVPECPCNQARRFEDWIIRNAERLAEYLNRYSEKLKKDSEACAIPNLAEELKKLSERERYQQLVAHTLTHH